MSTPAPMFDQQDQLRKIQAMLLENEQIYAVYDFKGVGTGYCGITDRRVIVNTTHPLRTSKALLSIPYSRIVAVAAEEEPAGLVHRGFFSSSTVILSVAGGTHHALPFRGADKALHAHN